MNFRLLQLRLTETAVVKRSTASGGQYGAPVAVANVACSPVYDVEEAERERGDMVTVVRRTQLFAARPSAGIIHDGDVVEVSGETYTVNKAVPLPHRSDVQFYHLIVELKD